MVSPVLVLQLATHDDIKRFKSEIGRENVKPCNVKQFNMICEDVYAMQWHKSWSRNRSRLVILWFRKFESAVRKYVLYCNTKLSGIASTLLSLRVTINININSKLAGTGEDEQSILFETSRPNRLFSEPTLPRKRFYTWLYPQVYYLYLFIVTLTRRKNKKFIANGHDRRSVVLCVFTLWAVCFRGEWQGSLANNNRKLTKRGKTEVPKEV